MSKTHDIKIRPEHFTPVKAGLKTAEVRVNDRDYQVGDTLLLREWRMEGHYYTGESVEREITYITPLDDGLVLLSMKPTDTELATLRRELAVAKRALRHRTCFSSICDASECVEDSGGPDEQCAYRRELTQAAAQMEKEAGNGQD